MISIERLVAETIGEMVEADTRQALERLAELLSDPDDLSVVSEILGDYAADCAIATIRALDRLGVSVRITPR